MKQTIALLAIATATLFFGCLGQEEAQVSTPTTSSQVTGTGEFVSPPDGLLSPEKAKLYADASVALLLLSQQWIERMESTNEAQEKILILNGFDKARDQVCRKVGLAGVKEFNWISEEALKNPANRLTAEKAGIQFRIK